MRCNSHSSRCAWVQPAFVPKCAWGATRIRLGARKLESALSRERPNLGSLAREIGLHRDRSCCGPYWPAWLTRPLRCALAPRVSHPGSAPRPPGAGARPPRSIGRTGQPAASRGTLAAAAQRVELACPLRPPRDQTTRPSLRPNSIFHPAGGGRYMARDDINFPPSTVPQGGIKWKVA